MIKMGLGNRATTIGEVIVRILAKKLQKAKDLALTFASKYSELPKYHMLKHIPMPSLITKTQI